MLDSFYFINYDDDGYQIIYFYEKIDDVYMKSAFKYGERLWGIVISEQEYLDDYKQFCRINFNEV